MNVTYEGRPAYTMAFVSLRHGESLNVERHAMGAMSGGISVSAGTNGGVITAALRKVFGQESFLVGSYQAQVDGAWVGITPPRPGDVAAVDLVDTGPLRLTAGSYLASTDGDVRISPAWGGVSNVLMREGAFILQVSGEGRLFMGSYGAILEKPLQGGETLVVDTGHLVAWSADMKIDVGLLGGAVTSAASGEGLVARITGPGTVWMQTRKEYDLGSVVSPKREQNR